MQRSKNNEGLKNIHSDVNKDPFTFETPLARADYQVLAEACGESKSSYFDYLKLLNSFQGYVEFFNKYYQCDWFRNKYDPALRRTELLRKKTVVSSAMSSFVTRYVAYLRSELLLTENTPSNFVCVPSVPLLANATQVRAFFANLGFSESKEKRVKVDYSPEKLREVYVAEPTGSPKARRMAWAVFEDAESAEKAAAALNGQIMVKTFKAIVLPAKSGGRQPKTAPAVFDLEARFRLDFLLCAKLLAQLVLDNEEALLSWRSALQTFLQQKFLVTDCFSDTELGGKKVFVKDLSDFAVHLLRETISFCYFCGKLFLNKDECFARCGRVHLRSCDLTQEFTQSVITAQELELASDLPKLQTMSIQDLRVFVNTVTTDKKTETELVPSDEEKQLEDRLAAHLNQEHFKRQGLLYLSDFPLVSYLEDKLTMYAKKTDEQAFSCELCDKRFAGAHFAQRHLLKQHEEKVRAGIKENYFREFLYNYVRDDHKLSFDEVRVEKKPEPKEERRGGRKRRRGREKGRSVVDTLKQLKEMNVDLEALAKVLKNVKPSK